MLHWVNILFLLVIGSWASVIHSASIATSGNETNVHRQSSIKVRRTRNAVDEGSGPPLPFLYIKEALTPVTEIPLNGNWILECEAAGTPPPVISWLKNGHRIQQNEDYDEIIDNDLFSSNSDVQYEISATKSRLYLDCMSAADEGDYSCVGSTPYKRVSSESQVFLTADLQSFLNPACLSQKKSLGKPARIIMWKSKMMPLIGDDVELFCQFTGDVSPTVHWMAGRETITNGDKYQIKENGNLIIRKVRFQDMKRYTCVAKNRFGEDRVTTFLYPLARGK